MSLVSMKISKQIALIIVIVDISRSEASKRDNRVEVLYILR